jgi:NAD(P)H-nitrite reductase large subunit
MARKLLCVCNFIPDREILKAIENGATDLEDIKEYTGAGTSCGRCRPAIENILKVQVNTIKEPQQRLF